ncbi:efflux RND transporter periplasmic adaptor subunit [Pseudomonas sp. P105]|uniref:efflux RND transporter periplasmic adaptor subunit n=1 Tax=Pseudomonas sp. P105 TaxID=3049542 RepID=UPI002934AD76|nr:efflux RND transporter periplasmic adaptor subunit [Pseudomonas sp. P105]WNZ80938.1 efflux RND transporter periplasmic adaptor subunit [Pseudomonas sp. P105]
MSIRLTSAAKPLLLLTFAGMGAAAVWFGYAANSSKTVTPGPVASSPVSVVIAQAAKREVRTWDEFSGRMEAVERVAIRSQVAGQIKDIRFKEGQLVKQGDVLLTIDPAIYAAAVAQAEAQTASAKARAAYTKAEAERARKLWPARAIALNLLEQRENDYLEAEAGLKAAQASLQVSRVNLGFTEIRAPVSGRIGRREVTTGNLVVAGPEGPVLTTLVSVDPIYVSFDADEQAVLRALGTLSKRDELSDVPIRIEEKGSDVVQGHLQMLDNQINAQSGTIRMRAVFANADGRLTPGQFARLQMGQVQPQEVILVDERAIGTDQDRRYVQVVGSDNKVRYQQVSLGSLVDNQRIVTEGLSGGESIVVGGLQRVRPGTLVVTQPVTKDDASVASTTH